MLPDTVERVPAHTAEAINERIQREADELVRHLARHPTGIDERLRQLDEEWDIERALEANAATIALGGTLLAATASKRWLVLPALVTGFLLQHSLQGWCPPLPILRRMGYRTAREIEEERIALKALRGDFAPVAQAHGDREGKARLAVEAARS